MLQNIETWDDWYKGLLDSGYPIGSITFFRNIESAAEFSYSMYEDAGHIWIPYIDNWRDNQTRALERYK